MSLAFAGELTNLGSILAFSNVNDEWNLYEVVLSLSDNTFSEDYQTLKVEYFIWCLLSN